MTENKNEKMEVVDKNLLDVDLNTSSDLKDRLMTFLVNPIFVTFIIILVAAIGIFTLVMVTRTPELPQAGVKEKYVGKIENPKVTVDVFEDLECPGCKSFNLIFEKLIVDYKEKDVKFVFHHYKLN